MHTRVMHITSFIWSLRPCFELPSMFSLPSLLPHELAPLHICIERSRLLLPYQPFHPSLPFSSLLLSCRAIMLSI